MNNSNKTNTICFFDLDATIVHVGTRFIDNPIPEGLEKDRSNPLYQEWLLSIQTPELLEKDIPVRGSQYLVGVCERSIYLTSRSELHKADTLKWLATHNYPIRPLIMRSKHDHRNYAEFKEAAIENYLSQLCLLENSEKEGYNVIIFDDDNKGKLEKICHKKGWVLFKARSGGIVL